MTLSPFASTAHAVYTMGFCPVLIHPLSKKPVWNGFNQWEMGTNAAGYNYSPAILDHWASGYPQANIGILTRDCHCVDVDAPELLASIGLWDILPPTPHCKRGARGLALMYRPDPANPIRRTRTFSHPVTTDMMLEVLANGRQTILPPSIHPDTGRPYEWIVGPWGGEPTSLAPDMPMLGQRHVEALEAALEAAGLTRVKRRRAAAGGATILGMEEHRVRYERWLAVKLEDKYALVDQAPKGARQQTLNDAMLSLAPFVRVGLLHEESLYERMLHGCHKNGWIAEDKQAAFDRQFEKALADGWDNDLPALQTAVGEHSMEAARLLGPAPYVPPHVIASAPPVVSGPEPIVPLPFRDAGEQLKKARKPREWEVEGWIPARQVTGFFGGGAGGKTTVLLQLAYAASAGGKWMGMPVQRRNVLFVSGEDEADELDYRGHDVALACPPGPCLQIMSLDEDESDNPPFLAVSGARGQIELTQTFLRIEDHIRRHGITLAIFDPVVNLFGGNMNDNTEVTAFVTLLRKRLCRRLGCTVIFAMHPSGDGMRTGAGDGGAKSWSNSVRARLYIEDHPDDGDCRIISLKKSNRSSRKGAEIIVKWVKGIFVHGVQAVKQPMQESTRTAILEEIGKRNCMYRWNPCINFWVGDIIGKVLGRDMADQAGKREVKAMLLQWEMAGLIRRHLAKDAKREEKEYVEVLQP